MRTPLLQLAAELQEKDRKLQESEALRSALTVERDRAVAELHPHRVMPERESQAFAEDEKQYPSKHFPSSEIQKLQEQNSGLRAVIAEMRKEMEVLSEPTAPLTQETKMSQERKPDVSVAGPSETIDSGYIQSLEEEIGMWKQKCRAAEEKLEDSAMATKMPPPITRVPNVSTENAYIQSHVRALNETIGALRADKVASAGASKKLETRVAHLDSMVKQLTQKLGQKQVDSDQLRYELTNRTQQTHLELSAAQQRVSELELQLSEARKEAEEYFKGNLQQNLQVVALGNEVSALKLDLACNRAPVVVQESSVIKQLQEEILRLRQNLNLCHSGDGPQQPLALNIQLLQTKLREAMSRISDLSREKEQLIDLGNRLRADLMTARNPGFLPSSSSPKLTSNAPDSAIPTVLTTSETPSRLSTLEQLQYQLTTQELQYAQRQQNTRVADTGTPSSADSWDVQNKPRNRANLEEPPRTKRVMQSSNSHKTPNQQKENAPPNQRAPQNHNGVKNSFDQPPGASSSGDDGAFQEIWQILEMGSSPSTLSSRDHTEQELQPVRDVMKRNDGVCSSQKKANQTPHLKGVGKKADIQQKSKLNRFVYDRAGKSKTPPSNRRIRNYNVRD